jgi:hypothetical protein
VRWAPSPPGLDVAGSPVPTDDSGARDESDGCDQSREGDVAPSDGQRGRPGRFHRRPHDGASPRARDRGFERRRDPTGLEATSARDCPAARTARAAARRSGAGTWAALRRDTVRAPGAISPGQRHHSTNVTVTCSDTGSGVERQLDTVAAGTLNPLRCGRPCRWARERQPRPATWSSHGRVVEPRTGGRRDRVWRCGHGAARRGPRPPY